MGDRVAHPSSIHAWTQETPTAGKMSLPPTEQQRHSERHMFQRGCGGVGVGNYTIGKFIHIGVNSPPSQLTFVCVCACMCVHVCGLNCLGNTRAFLLSGQQASFLFYFPACDPWPLSPIPCPHRHNTEASKSPPPPVTLQRTWVMGLILLGASCPHS